MTLKYLVITCMSAFASLTLVSCDNLPEHSTANHTSLAFKRATARTALLPRVATLTQSLDAAAKINRVIDIWNERCAVPDCPTTAINFSPAESTVESLGQRILILESFFVPDSAMLRYRNRILGFYKFSETAPKYEEYFPDTEVYTPLEEISKYLSDLPYHVPAEALDLSRIKKSGFSRTLKHQPFMAHGVPIFDWLADLAPEAQFVIAQSPNSLFSLDFLCHFDEGENLTKMTTTISHAVIEVLRLIDRHQISYVNISEAPSPEGLKRNYAIACESTGSKPFSAISRKAIERFLKLEAFVFKKLSEIPEISVFQGLPNDDHTVYRPENSSDELVAANYENFVRVGYFATADYDFDERGGFDSAVLDRGQLNQVHCASTYINGGFTEGSLNSDYEPEPLKISPSALHYKTLGFHTKVVVKLMATSWATPLALAHAIYLKNSGGPQTPRELRRYFETSTRKPKLIDPLRFRQFELYAEE